MTKNEILNMPAGREMDALVWLALHDKPLDLLMCRHVDGDIQPNSGYPTGHISPPNYSTDTVYAWKVYEKLISGCKQNRGEPDFIMLIAYPDGTFYIAKTWAHHDGDIVEFELTANTASLAICRAFLLATMEIQ